MDFDEVVKIICALLTGIATAIPLIIKLIQYVKAAAREKNWQKLIELVIKLMGNAEKMFDSGAEKKAWVMNTVKELSAVVDYDVDENELSALIDSLCDMSKKVNPPA